MSDVFIILMFCIITNIPIKLKRVFIASITGALLSCAVMLISRETVIPKEYIILQKAVSSQECMISQGFVMTQLFAVGVSFVMLLILVGGKSGYTDKCIGTYIRYITILYAISFMNAGIISFIKKNSTINMFMLGACFVLVTLIVRAMSRYGGITDIRKCNEVMYEVTMIKGNRSINGIGYYDSGNGMYEPISGAMVILASADDLAKFLTEGEKHYIKLFPQIPDQWDGVTYIRGIPYSSIGKEKGILPGIRIDKVELMHGKRVKEYIGCYLAVYPGMLSAKGKYNFIIHRNMKLF